MLGVDFSAVEEHLKTPACRGLQLQRGNLMLEFFQQFLRQTDGMGFVVSGGAVFDGDRHSLLSAGQRGGASEDDWTSPPIPPS